jgi:uncharacterized protein (DUF1499 family)
MVMTLLKWIAIVLIAVVVLGILAGRMGWLQGSTPARLGVKDGRLEPPSTRPNSVSSQARLHPDHPQLAYASIEPLAITGDGATTLSRIATLVQGMPGGRVVKQDSAYLYATFETRLMRYVDDVEFWLDPAGGVIQVRSASRLGYRDRGVNRARVEAIRAALKGAPGGGG